LAFKFYDNPSYWWILALANGIKGTMYVQPGTRIRIPESVNEVINDHRKINNR
jgi:nucleoid-associated protein YgaU